MENYCIWLKTNFADFCKNEKKQQLMNVNAIFADYTLWMSLFENLYSSIF